MSMWIAGPDQTGIKREARHSVREGRGLNDGARG